MKSLSKLYPLVVAATAAAIGSVAGADEPFTETRPTGAQFQMGEWTLVAVRTMDEVGVHVRGVLALRAKQNAVGSNIVSIWYEHPTSGQTHWVSKAWESMEQWDAIKVVKADCGVGDQFDAIWPTNDQLNNASSGLQLPKEYDKGFFTDDVMYHAVMASPNRDELVVTLSEWGQAVADVKGEKTGSCAMDAVLAAYADSVESAVFTKATSKEAFAAILAPRLSAACAQVIGQTTPPPPPPVPTFPGTTVPYPDPACTPLTPGGPAWKMPPTTPPTGPWYWRTPGTVRSLGVCAAGVCCYDHDINHFIVCPGWAGQIIMICTSTISYTCPAPAGTPPATCPAVPSCTPTPPFAPAPGTTSVNCQGYY